MNIRDQKVAVNVSLGTIVFAIFLLLFVPLFFFFGSFAFAGEMFVEFVLAAVADFAISIGIFVVLRIVTFNLIYRNVFDMNIIETEIIIKNNSKEIDLGFPDVVFRDCIINEKIKSRIVGFKYESNTIFAEFYDSCDLRKIDDSFRAEYSSQPKKVEGKVVKIRKLTKSSSG